MTSYAITIIAATTTITNTNTSTASIDIDMSVRIYWMLLPANILWLCRSGVLHLVTKLKTET